MAFSDIKWPELCKDVKNLVSKDIGEDAWALVLAATVAAFPSTELMGEFYTYLLRHEASFSDETSRIRLSVRFRDLLLKRITPVGAPQVLCVLIPLAAAEGNTASKSSKSLLDEQWSLHNLNAQALYGRGDKTIKAIYGFSLLPKIFDTWGSHKEDVKFNEIFTVCRLYLSDFDVLTALESEAVVHAVISCLGLINPGNWHLRGMGRMLGARGRDSDTAKARQIRAT